jgi:hypothetical protein
VQDGKIGVDRAAPEGSAADKPANGLKGKRLSVHSVECFQHEDDLPDMPFLSESLPVAARRSTA